MKKTAVLILAIAFVSVLGYKKYNQFKFEKELKEYRELSQELDPNYNPSSKRKLNNNSFAIAAQQYVLDALKSPSTAKFPSLNDSRIDKSENGLFIVSSYVDSENGFGATIRSNYQVVFKKSTNNNLELVNISISK
jgi:hypothetical protein